MIDVIPPSALAARLGTPDLVIVDGSYYLPAAGRDAEAEYRAKRIPGAIRFDIDAVKDATNPLPHMLPDPASFARAVGALGIGDGMSIVVYDGAGLFSAPRVAWTFAVFGARDVAVLDGGLPAWEAEGLPVDTEEPAPPRARTFTARFDNGAVAGLADIRAALETGSAQVVDARSAARFTGEEPEPRAGMRSGHMPGARNLHYADLLRDGRLRPSDEIRAAVERAGIDPERPVITSCGSGVTAAILWLAFERMGKPARKLYDGSWSEWGSRDDTPVATGPA